MRKWAILGICLCGGLFYGADGLREVADSQGNRYKVDGEGIAPAIAVTAQKLKTTLEENIPTVQGNILKRRGVELKPIKAALPAGGESSGGMVSCPAQVVSYPCICGRRDIYFRSRTEVLSCAVLSGCGAKKTGRTWEWWLPGF